MECTWFMSLTCTIVKQDFIGVPVSHEDICVQKDMQINLGSPFGFVRSSLDLNQIHFFFPLQKSNSSDGEWIRVCYCYSQVTGISLCGSVVCQKVTWTHCFNVTNVSMWHFWLFFVLYVCASLGWSECAAGPALLRRYWIQRLEKWRILQFQVVSLFIFPVCQYFGATSASLPWKAYCWLVVSSLSQCIFLTHNKYSQQCV
jgi:hypothetical protein